MKSVMGFWVGAFEGCEGFCNFAAFCFDEGDEFFGGAGVSGGPGVWVDGFD
jgi:hypothetical protein